MRTILAILLLTQSAALCQTTGQLTGRVTDTSGAVIPNAKIHVTNLNTGIQRETASNEFGYYNVTALDPGRYRATVQKAGFKSVARTDVVLEIQHVIRMDVTLEVGQLTEEIQVTSALPVLDAESSAVGQVIDNKSILEIPLNGRNSWDLVQIMGGAVYVRGVGEGGEAPAVSIAGGRAFAQMYWVDGASAQKSSMDRTMAQIAPIVDAVQEFKVISNNYSAEFGRAVGGVFTAVTRSGTNQFHGTLFEFARNDALDALNYFAVEKAKLRFHQFGGTFGGPVVRDKTHFFLAYQRTRVIQGNPFLFTLPASVQKQGDFSTLRDAAGRLIPIYDPYTTRPDPADSTRRLRDPIPNNRIPAASIDPVGLKAVSFYPDPNRGAALTANNFITNLNSNRTQSNGSARVDHAFSERDRVFGRYIIFDSVRPQISAFDPAASGAGGPGNISAISSRVQNVVGSYARIVSPALLNDFKFNWQAQKRDVLHDSIDGGWPSKLGLKGVGEKAFPRFLPQGYTALGPASPFRQEPTRTYELVDSITYTRGRHAIKAGFDYRYNRRQDEFDQQPSGAFNFVQQGTGLQGVTNSGNSIASMLLGFVTQAQFLDTPQLHFRASSYGWWLQDDWKVTPRLTLNVGVRYDIETPRRSPENTSTGFDLARIHPVAGVPGVARFAGVDGEPATLFDIDYNDVGPRFGFAWRPFGERTVVRGGYGVFYGAPDTRGSADGSRAALGFATSLLLVSPDQNQTSVMQLRNGFPPFTPPGPETRNPSFGVGLPINYYERSRRTPYSQQFNLSVQRQVKDVLLEAQYVGNLGRKLTGSDIEINQVRPEQVGRPGTIQSRRPFPQFTSVILDSPNFGVSSYHALMLRVERRYNNGLQFLVNYAFSKYMDNIDDIVSGDLGGTPGDGYQDYYNRRLDRSLSPNDIKHNLNFSAIWDLPAGRGRRWLSTGLASQVLGGWQLSALSTVQSGPPYGVVVQQNTCECFSSGPQRADILRDPSLPSDRRSVGRWFDTGAFALPARFQFGNAARAVGRAPGLANINLGLMKNFLIGDRVRVQFRGELFNAFNHPNFGTPATSLGAPGFATINTAKDARIVQLGLKLYF